MRIIGIDPGIAIVGWGVIDYNGNKFSVVDYGAVLTEAHTEVKHRLKIIYDDLTEILTKYKPDYMAIEELFYNNNAKTVINVAQARGVALLASTNQNVEIFEYTPPQVKIAVTGYGRADKKQIQQMTKMILNLEKIPKPDDTADALAIAICHAHSFKLKSLNYRG